MWTPTTRRQHSRDGLRYETDLTDAEWARLEPLMPRPNPRGRPRAWPLREIVNAIFYVLRGGPPLSVVFTLWLSSTAALGDASRPTRSRSAMTSRWRRRGLPLDLSRAVDCG